MSKAARMRIMGELEIFKTDLKGTRRIRHVKNTIVDGGEIWVTEIMAKEESGGSDLSQGTGELGDGLQYVQIGYDTNATTDGMFKIQNHANITTFTKTLDNDVASPYNKIVSRGTYATDEAISDTSLTEAGLFSNNVDPGSGTDTASRMFNRTTFGGISKTSGSEFSLTLQWTITFGSV